MASEAAANQQLANDQLQCDNGYQDFCQIVQTYEQCFGAAEAAARTASNVPYSSQTHDASEYLGQAGDFLSAAETTAIHSTGREVLGAVDLVVSTVTSIISLNNAYNACFG